MRTTEEVSQVEIDKTILEKFDRIKEDCAQLLIGCGAVGKCRSANWRTNFMRICGVL